MNTYVHAGMQDRAGPGLHAVRHPQDDVSGAGDTHVNECHPELPRSLIRVCTRPMLHSSLSVKHALVPESEQAS